MNNERLRILTMLAEGKITSSEALNLIEALDSSGSKNQSSSGMDLNQNLLESIQKSFDELNKKTESISSELLNKVESIGRHIESKMDIDPEKINESLNTFQNEFKTSIDKISKDMSMDNNSLSSKISESVFDLNKKGTDPDKLNEYMEDLKKCLTGISINIPGLNDKLPNIFKNIDLFNGPSNTFTKTYSKTVSDSSDLKLTFESTNGSIIIEGHDEDEVLIDMYCRTPEKDIRRIITVIDKPDIYGVKTKALSNTVVNLNVQIPKKKFLRIYISTFNDKIQVSDISCSTLMCTAPKGRITISGVSCDIIDCSTSRSKIELSDIVSKKLFVKTSDSPVTADNINCSLCHIKTSDNRIFFAFSDEFAGKNETTLTTSNGKIEADLYLLPETGVYVDGSTTDGNINIDIPDIYYKINEQSIPGSSHVICQRENFNTAKNTVKITAHTTNAWIGIK